MPIVRGLTFDDVLLVPNYGNESRDDGNIATCLGKFRYDIPIASANMESITGIDMAVAVAGLGGLAILHRFMPVDVNANAYITVRNRLVTLGSSMDIGVSVGVGESERERAVTLHSAGARLFCVDIAHAHSKQVGKMVKWMRNTYDDITIIAGNVATYGGADYLVSVGADIVKVGVGAGSVCTTRQVTGFGVPQLTAIMDCVRIGRPIIADGGIRTSGDAVKALAAGAKMVMFGAMLSGTDEAENKHWYRGMASAEAQEEYFGESNDAPEGVAVTVKSKGPVADVIKTVIGGIKSGLSYAGADDLDDLWRKAQFMEVTAPSVVEGTPHGLG